MLIRLSKILFILLFYLENLLLIQSNHLRQSLFESITTKSPPTKRFQLKHIYHYGKPEAHVLKHKTKKSTKLQIWHAKDDMSYTPPFHFDFEGLKLLSEWQKRDRITINNKEDKTLDLRKAVLALGRMTEHAYSPLPDKPWEDVGDGWHEKEPFGWDENKLRGYVFSDKEEKNMVIAFKGTALPFIPGSDGSTAPSDKTSDNLMFSCCCGVGNTQWTRVCDCYQKDKLCNGQCLEESVQSNMTYFHAAELIYDQAKLRYPDTEFMLVGHSLGGSLAALVALKKGIGAISFEAPGERLYAKRLGLELNPNGKKPFIFHIGNNADPLFMGTCNGILSLCYLAGYSMDTKCHTATKCTFDTKGSLGWSESLLNHRIGEVNDKLLANWVEGKQEITFQCGSDTNCTDCTDWSFDTSPDNGDKDTYIKKEIVF